MASGVVGRQAPVRDSAMAGIGLQFALTKNAIGVQVPVVTDLSPDGPAAASGQVMVGDTIVACDGHPCAGTLIHQRKWYRACS